jgi:cyclopropane-fatty-acyl-phospholipid synthase
MKIIDNYLRDSFRKIADNLLSKIKLGNLSVIYPDGEKFFFLGDRSGYSVDIQFNNYKLFTKLLHKGATGLAESYMDGDFDTKDLSKLLLFCYENESYFLKGQNKYLILDYYIKFKHYLNENTKSKSKKNISYHYDLGNDFYKHWLDKSMTYSSAIFSSSNSDLFEAQINKYKEIAKPLNLNENSTLLEIGCGWGGFSTFVAKNYGANVTAITISKEQYNFASKKIFDEGLTEKVDIQIKDYREINKNYSHIASIEMFEAVGKKYWETFLNTVKNSLLPDGLASLQIITISDDKANKYQNNPDFIQQYIFPGGVLPSKVQLEKITNQIGLSLTELQTFKNSYAKTLQIWNNKFQIAWPNIAAQGFSLRFKKMWEYYLSYCEAGFISGATDVSQFIIKK